MKDLAKCEVFFFAIVRVLDDGIWFHCFGVMKCEVDFV